MMMTPIFGEFLHPATGHITAVVSSPAELPDETGGAVARELSRVVTTLARYLGDLPLPDEFDPALNPALKPEVRAAGEARQALQWAAASLLPEPAASESTPDADTHPIVRHLSAAADLLTAGRDLLHTHFTGPPSAQTARSDWAAVILSWPVTSALISEVAACARRLAPWAAQLPGTGLLPPGGPAEATAAGLHIASRWLWTAGAAVSAAQEGPPSAEVRELLAAVPLNVPPAAQPPGRPELVPQLCEGITVTAERLRHATHAYATSARWAPEATSVSWRRDALASAITTHSSVFILRMLTQRARQLSFDTAVQAQLRTAAMAINTVWPAWYKVAREWDIITTGRHPPGSLAPVAAEIGELALRTGRLARRDPHWTPARTGLGLIRDPATLAPARGDVPAVLAAVHHAADATARIAAEDRLAVRQAAFDGRLYVPTGLVPARDQIPYQHAPVGWPRARRLLATYTAVIDVSARAVSTLDDLAVTMSATSRSLGQTRALAAQLIGNDLAPPHVRALEQDTHHSAQPEPGAVGQVIRDLAISEPATLLRAVALDQAVDALTADAKAQSQRRAAALDTPARLTTRPSSQATPRPGQHSALSIPMQAQIKRDR
jgi:hypothetical protein